MDYHERVSINVHDLIFNLFRDMVKYSRIYSVTKLILETYTSKNGNTF